MTSKIANISQLLAGFDQVDDDCGLMSKARCVDLCLAASLVAGAACDGRTSHPHENPDPSVAGEQDDDAASA